MSCWDAADPNVRDLVEANRITKTIRARSRKLTFRSVNLEVSCVPGVCDAAFDNLPCLTVEFSKNTTPNMQ